MTCLALLIRALGWGALVFLVSIGAQWLFYEVILDDPGGMRLISPMVAAVATAVLAFQLRSMERERAQATQKRFQIIAEMNHHIRNALQVLSYQASLGSDDRGQVREALDRIEWTLRDVLPAVTEVQRPLAPASQAQPKQSFGATPHAR